jgi:peroxiredoxin
MVLMRHLLGRPLPDVALPASSGGAVELARVPGRMVLFCYPYTGRPGYPDPPHWDDIPGAHGSTAQALAYQALYGDFRRLGLRLFGVSLLAGEWQRDFVKRTGLSFRLLSDEARGFSGRLGLPLFETGGVAYLQRLTMVVNDGVIEHLRFPVPDPAGDAAETLALLTR